MFIFHLEDHHFQPLIFGTFSKKNHDDLKWPQMLNLAQKESHSNWYRDGTTSLSKQAWKNKSKRSAIASKVDLIIVMCLICFNYYFCANTMKKFRVFLGSALIFLWPSVQNFNFVIKKVNWRSWTRYQRGEKSET